MIQVSLGKRQDTTSKKNRAKKAGNMVQMVKSLPCNHEALSFLAQYYQKKKSECINDGRVTEWNPV
jgi:hypothetical protein